MADIVGEVWECRLCGVNGMAGGSLLKHLTDSHDARPASYRLHASKDSPDQADNTIGFYDGEEQLLAVMVRLSVRPADDPMRFGG